MLNMFKLTPEKMKAQLLAAAEKELVEAEHYARLYAHKANAARETIVALRPKEYVAGITAETHADLKSLAASLTANEPLIRRDFIGSKK